MKMYNLSGYIRRADQPGKLDAIVVSPPSNGPKVKTGIVLISRELSPWPEKMEYPVDVDLGLVGEKKTPMIFPATNKADKRILLLADIPQPGHRRDGTRYAEKCTGRFIHYSEGYGAWGSGACFIAILNPGERIVSNKFIVWENQDGVLVCSDMNQAEYELAYESAQIERL